MWRDHLQAPEDLNTVIEHQKEAISKHFDPGFMKHIKKSAMAINDSVEKFFKYKNIAKRLAEDIEYMTKDAAAKQYPPGTRPFRASATDIELDVPASCSADRPFQAVTTIPQGATRREAMAIVHHTTTVHIKYPRGSSRSPSPSHQADDLQAVLLGDDQLLDRR